mmetsp:Transcript_15406/g.50256  ORF Transcript_15406/g.50256 Transcript_15406/m.50256 type:complete len:282 (+) Transcript_15406:1456-2301(+)
MDGGRREVEHGIVPHALLPVVLRSEYRIQRVGVGKVQPLRRHRRAGVEPGCIGQEEIIPSGRVGAVVEGVAEDLVADIVVRVFGAGADVVEENDRHDQVEHDCGGKDVVKDNLHQAVVRDRRRGEPSEENVAIDPVGRPQVKEDEEIEQRDGKREHKAHHNNLVHELHPEPESHIGVDRPELVHLRLCLGLACKNVAIDQVGHRAKEVHTEVDDEGVAHQSDEHHLRAGDIPGGAEAALMTRELILIGVDFNVEEEDGLHYNGENLEDRHFDHHLLLLVAM